MKIIPIALQNHLAEPLTTISTCWKVELLDGAEYGFTDHDVNISGASIAGWPDSTIFLATAGYSASDIANNNNLEVDNLELQGLLVSDSINEEDLVTGKWDGATIKIFEVNWADLSQGFMWMKVGRLGKVTRGNNKWKAELLGLSFYYQTSVVETCSPGCRATFGDERCKFDVSDPSITKTGTADGYDATTMTLLDATRVEANDFFAYGFVRFTSGDNFGFVAEIKQYRVGEIDVQLNPPYPIAGGESYVIQRGCGKTWDDWCRDVYDNLLNFRGEPHLMGNDLLMQTGRRRS